MQVQTLYPAIGRLLMNRGVAIAFMAEAIRKGVLELTESYKFQGLEVSGPTVAFTPLVANYSPNYFLAPADDGIELNQVNSFFVYNNPFVPVTSSSQTNAGYNIKYRTIDNIENLINIPGLPLYWTRHEGEIWVGSMPDQAYNVYMRYQKEHPFPNAGTVNAGNDTLYLPNSWQDILEYVGAMRLAQEIGLSSKVTEFQTRLYGDVKFQKTGGIEGQPGLIFQRTSQRNRDQSTAMKRTRLRMGQV